jgi:hypothetical protein
MGMKRTVLRRPASIRLSALSNVIDDGFQFGVDVVQAGRDLGELMFQALQPGVEAGCVAAGHRARWAGRIVAAEHVVQVSWWPAQCCRQCFESSRAPPPFHDVVLDLADGCLRDV